MSKGNRPTKTARRERARDELMLAMQAAWNSVYDVETDDDDRAELLAEMDRQMRRVERLFGYEPGSWQRGV